MSNQEKPVDNIIEKDESSKVVPIASEAKPSPPTKPLLYQLTENEILKFKNIGLQRQLHDSEVEKLLLQKELIAQQISVRVGQNVSRWDFDLKKGVVMHPQQAPQSQLTPTQDS